jgi:manganese efflux pump family protein
MLWRGVLAVFLLAFALAMDALALSLVRGCAAGHQLSEAVKCGATFGLAQGLMPIVGWSLGLAFAESFQSVDHWIAFTLLSVLGAMMLKAGFTSDREPAGLQSALSMLGLLAAAFATSVDAAAAGLALPLLGLAIPAACLIIGATTAVLCTIGYLVGARISPLAGKWAERIGGVVLIGLGIRILVQHLGH